jgi:hypothetical protein
MKRNLLYLLAAACATSCGGSACTRFNDIVIDQNTPLLGKNVPGSGFITLQDELGDCIAQGKEQNYEADIEIVNYFSVNPMGHFAIGMRIDVIDSLTINISPDPSQEILIPGLTGHGVIFGNLTGFPDPEQAASKTPVGIIESFNKRVPVGVEDIRLYQASESPLLGNGKYRLHMTSYFDGKKSMIRYKLKKYENSNLYDFYDSGYVEEYKKYDKNLYKTRITFAHVFGDTAGNPWQIKITNQRFYLTH